MVCLVAAFREDRRDSEVADIGGLPVRFKD